MKNSLRVERRTRLSQRTSKIFSQTVLHVSTNVNEATGRRASIAKYHCYHARPTPTQVGM